MDIKNKGEIIMTLVEELRSKKSRDNRELLNRAADRIEELENTLEVDKTRIKLYRKEAYRYAHIDPTIAEKSMKVMLESWAHIPTRAHEHDAGCDLRTPHDVIVMPHSSAVVDTGVHIELPPNTVGMIKSKSGLNVRSGLVSEGVIDVGYTGSIVVKLYNHSDTPYGFKAGDKITQLVIMPILTPTFELVDEFAETARGNNGFGSSGK
jgi:dUTP pyrophosphatase